MVGELRLLSVRFRNLKSGDNYKAQLKECVDRHVMLMEAKRVMQRVFGFLSVWLAITCAITICANIFQFSQVCYFLNILLLLTKNDFFVDVNEQHN